MRRSAERRMASLSAPGDRETSQGYQQPLIKLIKLLGAFIIFSKTKFNLARVEQCLFYSNVPLVRPRRVEQYYKTSIVHSLERVEQCLFCNTVPLVQNLFNY